MTTRAIPLTQGLYAHVDEADYERVIAKKWCASAVRTGGRTYALTGGRQPDGSRRNNSLHRFLMEPPDGFVVDHIDGDGLNCTRANMRVCSPEENCLNRPIYRNNSSGFKGVRRYRWGRFAAFIGVRGKTFWGRLRNTAEEAARDYDELSRKHHGEFGRLNFPGAA